jgi:hypothetical protein
MKVSVAVVWQAGCPTCHVACGVQCRTPSRRNHPARVRAAIEQSLYDLQFPHNEGLRLRERARKSAEARV